jgi:hypothetical protein
MMVSEVVFACLKSTADAREVPCISSALAMQAQDITGQYQASPDA